LIALCLMQRLLGPIPAIVFVVLASGAMAKEKSSIAYYPVTGSNAAAVYTNIKQSSPRIARNSTFAFTLIATKTDKESAESGDGCRYTNFTTSAAYVFHLPQHVKSASLPKATLGKWKNFVSYLQRHEEGHRTIWRECFKTYDAEALTLTTGSCDKLDVAREKLFTKIKRGCIAQDEAYDVVFRKEVLKEPFIAEALKQGGPSRK
jgi:predicted secreted Zn-dependent protease